MKRSLVFVLAALMLCALLAACKGSDKDDGKTPAASSGGSTAPVVTPTPTSTLPPY